MFVSIEFRWWNWDYHLLSRSYQKIQNKALVLSRFLRDWEVDLEFDEGGVLCRLLCRHSSHLLFSALAIENWPFVLLFLPTKLRNINCVAPWQCSSTFCKLDTEVHSTKIKLRSHPPYKKLGFRSTWFPSLSNYQEAIPYLNTIRSCE